MKRTYNVEPGRYRGKSRALRRAEELGAEANSDGERIRWLLTEIEELDAAQGLLARWNWANFLQQQFGVDTLADQTWLMRSSDSEDEDGSSKHGIFDIHTLEDDEAIARLANGIRRFKSPMSTIRFACISQF